MRVTAADCKALGVIDEVAARASGRGACGPCRDHRRRRPGDRREPGAPRAPARRAAARGPLREVPRDGGLGERVNARARTPRLVRRRLRPQNPDAADRLSRELGLPLPRRAFSRHADSRRRVRADTPGSLGGCSSRPVRDGGPARRRGASRRDGPARRARRRLRGLRLRRRGRARDPDDRPPKAGRRRAPVHPASAARRLWTSCPDAPAGARAARSGGDRDGGLRHHGRRARWPRPRAAASTWSSPTITCLPPTCRKGRCSSTRSCRAAVTPSRSSAAPASPGSWRRPSSSTPARASESTRPARRRWLASLAKIAALLDRGGHGAAPEEPRPRRSLGPRGRSADPRLPGSPPLLRRPAFPAGARPLDARGRLPDRAPPERLRRIDHAARAFELLTTRTPRARRALADEIEAANDERRAVQERVVDAVLDAPLGTLRPGRHAVVVEAGDAGRRVAPRRPRDRGVSRVASRAGAPRAPPLPATGTACPAAGARSGRTPLFSRVAPVAARYTKEFRRARRCARPDGTLGGVRGVPRGPPLGVRR